MVTTTYQTVRQVGIREDLSDDIYDISPMDTPYFQLLKKGAPAKNVFIEWQKDALATAVGTNKAVQGADMVALTATPTVRPRNYTNISVKGIIVSGTSNAVNTAGRKEELAYQIAKRGREIKRDMETQLTGNYASVAPASATASVSAGFEAWITTNDLRGSAGSQGGYTAAGTVTAATDSSAGALITFTEARLKSAVRLAWAAGGSPSVVMLGPKSKVLASAFTGIRTASQDYGMAPKSGAGLVIMGAADLYLSNFGLLKLVPNRFSRERSALGIDPEYLSLHYLRPFQVMPIAKSGDAEKKQMLVEYTQCMKNEAAHFIIADLNS